MTNTKVILMSPKVLKILGHGVMEWWRIGVKLNHSNTPVLQHSNTPVLNEIELNYL